MMRGSSVAFVQRDVAMDAFEGTTLTATGLPGAISVVALAEQGNLLHTRVPYMDKIVVDPRARGAISLDAPMRETLESSDREVRDLTVLILNRPRNQRLIYDVRRCGARIGLSAMEMWPGV